MLSSSFLTGLLSSMAAAAHEEVARDRGGRLGRGRRRGGRRPGLEVGATGKEGATGASIGSYLKDKGLEGHGLDVVRLETTGIEFDSEYTLNSS